MWKKGMKRLAMLWLIQMPEETYLQYSMYESLFTSYNRIQSSVLMVLIKKIQVKMLTKLKTISIVKSTTTPPRNTPW